MTRETEDPYADIIHLPHHVSRHYPPMSMADRAAQFSPFAALNGHDAAVAEAARLTEERSLLDNEEKWAISATLQRGANTPGLVLDITWFIPDARKNGGSHTRIRGCISKLNISERTIQLQDGTLINIDDIVSATEL